MSKRAEMLGTAAVALLDSSLVGLLGIVMV